MKAEKGQGERHKNSNSYCNAKETRDDAQHKIYPGHVAR